MATGHRFAVEVFRVLDRVVLFARLRAWPVGGRDRVLDEDGVVLLRDRVPALPRGLRVDVDAALDFRGVEPDGRRVLVVDEEALPPRLLPSRPLPSWDSRSSDRTLAPVVATPATIPMPSMILGSLASLLFDLRLSLGRLGSALVTPFTFFDSRLPTSLRPLVAKLRALSGSFFRPEAIPFFFRPLPLPVPFLAAAAATKSAVPVASPFVLAFMAVLLVLRRPVFSR